MAKNAYLEKQAAMRQGYFTAGLQSGRQQILDMVSLVLRDPEIMGKDIFGKDRLLKVVQGVGDYSGSNSCYRCVSGSLRRVLQATHETGILSNRGVIAYFRLSEGDYYATI